MPQIKTTLRTNIAIFSFIGVIHLLRILFQWEVRFGNWDVAYWLNGIAIILVIIMVYLNARHLR